MQTIYCTSSRLVYRESNIIDLNRYRAGLEHSANGDETDGHAERAETAPRHRARRPGALVLSSWMMDMVASLGVVVMTAVFAAAMLA